MIYAFFDSLVNGLNALSPDTILWIVWGSFGAIALIVFVLALGLPSIRRASKTPFLCLVNIYSGLTLAAFSIFSSIPSALFSAALFWAAGYLLYGILVFLCRRLSLKPQPVRSVRVQDAAVTSPRPRPRPQPPRNAPQPNVRLEHAIAVTDRLLSRDLGKTDRMELEKLKNTLAVLRVKGDLSPAENEILNENFNTILKLMAKYNI